VKVLIIDDDVDIRFVAAMSLRAGGAIDVVEASGGLDGVCKAREEQPDVILLDMMMPMMDGSQTIAALRMQRETAATPVIFLTAKTIVAEIQGMKDLGAAGVLIKPFDPRTLAADVLALLTSPSAPESNADAQDQLAHVNGFAQDIVGPQREPGDPVAHIRTSRHQDDWDGAQLRIGLEQPAHRIAVEPRHGDIEQNQRRSLGAHSVDHALARAEGAREEPGVRERDAENLPLVGMIFNDQDFDTGRGRALRRRHGWRVRKITSERAPHLLQCHPCQRRINHAGGKQALEVSCATADGGKSDGPGQSNEPMHAAGQLRRRITGGMDQGVFQESGDGVAICDESGDETCTGLAQDARQLVRRR
jgi:CheY-like chemotaxis protein